MSNSMNGNEQEKKDGLSRQQFTGAQARDFQCAIEGQSQRVTRSLDSIAEALDKGTEISPEQKNHALAQILRLHLHLDDLKQWLDSIG